MRRWKLLLCLALAVCLLGSLNLTAFAEAGSGETGKPYSYTVRLYPGYYDDGPQSSEPVRSWEEVPFGASVNVSGAANVGSSVNEKFMVVGVKEAGKDSSDIFVNYTYSNVSEDKDFVIAYGIAGSVVSYTVTYSDINGNPVTPEDADGSPLPSRETFYGTPGDAVIVGCRDVPGYLPQAYNLRKTLSVNENENVFPFVYTPIQEVTEPPVDEEGNIVTDETDENIPDNGVPGANGPQDLIDLDEEDTPLGLLDLGKDALENGAELFGALPFGARMGLIGIDVILIGLLIWFIVRRKNKKKEQST